MSKLLLDTHTLLWLVTGSSRLGAQSLKAIERAQEDGELYVSSISYWEIALLLRRGRIQLSGAIDDWYIEVSELGVQEIPVRAIIALHSVDIEDFHGDPADRIIMATAQMTGRTLVTADRAMLAWRGRMNRLDASD